MKSLILTTVALVTIAACTSHAQAQWVRHYQPVFVQPQPVFVQPRPVVVSPAPVHRVYRRPVVTYHPTTIVTARHRPILGGTVVHTRPGYRRVVW